MKKKYCLQILSHLQITLDENTYMLLILEKNLQLLKIAAKNATAAKNCYLYDNYSF